MTGKNKAKLVALLVAAVILLIILFQNLGAETFWILFWKRALSQSLVLIVIFVLGFLGGLLAHRYYSRRRGKPDAGA